MVTGLDSSALLSSHWVQPEKCPEGDQRKGRLRLHILSLSFPAGLWVGRGLSSYKIKPPQIPETIFFSGPCRSPQHSHYPQGTSSSLGIT